MNVPMTALRHVPLRHQQRDHAERGTRRSSGTSSDRGRGARPSCWRSRPPRTGMPRPVTSSAPMITTRGTSSAEPLCGSHECCAGERQRLGLEHADDDAGHGGRNHQLEVTDGRGRERGNDGQACRPTGVSGLIGAMRIPAAPATTALAIQFSSAMRSGETPLTSAPICVSATARVRSPKRVQRYSAVSASVSPNDGDREIEAIGEQRRRSPSPRPRRKDRGHAHRRLTEPVLDEALHHDEDAERRHRPREQRSLPKRPEHDGVEQRAERRGERERDQCRRDEAERSADADRLRQARESARAACPRAATRTCTPYRARWCRWRS